MTRIAAVVVTFNRKVLLKECLDALLAQTTPLDKILLIDNASSDGTPDFLADGGYLRNRSIEYVRLPVNTGGAGGFYEGVKRAHLQGFDWIWIMDDDAEPKPDALETMSSSFSEEVSAVCNLVIDENNDIQYKHRGWFDFSLPNDQIVKFIRPLDLHNGHLKIEFSSFVGLAISRSSIDRCGYPNPDFFIHYDDNEYSLRLSSVGPIVLASRSIVIHKEAGKVERPEHIANFMGRKSTRIPIDRLWMTYYGNRNRIWLKRQRRGKFIGSIYAIQWAVRRCFGVLVYDDNKLRRMRFHINTLSDGLRGNFDNEKPKSLLKFPELRN
ncbi:MAG TPA: glycosyltransferase family 2 protein [Bellilinea sp.]|nr:glycosyltransferase family 2 protein [Bellilinea sp.]